MKISEAAVRRCSQKTPVFESLFNKAGTRKACIFIKKGIPTQVFSCEYCEIFKNSFLYKTPPVAGFVSYLLTSYKLKTRCGIVSTKKFVDLVRVCSLHIISRNHTNMLFQVKHCSKDYLFCYQVFTGLDRFLSIT